MPTEAILPFVRSLRALMEWIAHSFLCSAIYACVHGVRWFTHKVTGVFETGDTFFGLIKIDWIFDGADMVVLTAFGLFGVIAAVRAYRGMDG